VLPYLVQIVESVTNRRGVQLKFAYHGRHGESFTYRHRLKVIVRVILTVQDPDKASPIEYL